MESEGNSEIDKAEVKDLKKELGGDIDMDGARPKRLRK